jgi:hypothetical protein
LLRPNAVIASSVCDEAIHLAASEQGWIASSQVLLAMTGENAYRASIRLCYKAKMFPDRQPIVSRVVLDDRSRLPWRFFGRLTTSALAA